MTPDQLEKIAHTLKNNIEVRAAEYAADPQKGRAAGYVPEHESQPSGEVGLSSERVNMRSGLAAWMRGIARRELTGWQWRVDEGMGDNKASLVIVGRL
jgi:hypothetical protein